MMYTIFQAAQCQNHGIVLILEDESMRINYNSKEIIREIYVHDSLFCGFNYNYDERIISFTCKQITVCEQISYCKKHHFNFNNVIACNMQSCVFWGEGYNILSFSYEENSPYFKQLLAFQQS